MRIFILKHQIFRKVVSGAGFAGILFCSTVAFAQLPPLPGQAGAAPPGQEAFPADSGEDFSFDDDAFAVEDAVQNQQEQARKEAFDAALEGLYRCARKRFARF